MQASGHDGTEAVASAPLLVQRADRAALGGLLLVVAALWLAAAIRGVVSGDPAIVPGLGSAGACIAGALGAALALVAMDWMMRGQIVAIGRDTVTVSVWSLFGRRAWHEPIADYREIRTEREQRPHRYGPRSWYVVRLCHPENDRTIELARAKDPALIERRARDYARRLGLPLSWQDDEPPATLVLERDGEITGSAAGKRLSAT